MSEYKTTHDVIKEVAEQYGAKEFRSPDIKQAFQQAKQSSHAWFQRGPFIECTSCENKHGHYIGTNKRLTGIENGKPVLKTILWKQ